ncbi:MAG: PHP domain-containing protein [Gammaproteobacteria bacterium]
MAIPLSVKSHYSAGQGVASVETLVARAAALDLPALALADVDSLSAQPLFHALCQAHGIRAISGVELRGSAADGSTRIVALARDAAGYRSLCRIVSRRRGGAGTPAEQRAARDPVAAVAAHADGLFVLASDAPTLMRLVESGRMERASVRVLLRRPRADTAEPALLAAAAALGIGVVADGAAALSHAEDEPLALVVAAIGRGVAVGEELVVSAAERAARRPGPLVDGSGLFADAPDAVEASRRLAAECDFVLARGAPVLPGAETFERTPQVELAARCERALRERRARGVATAADATRLAEELRVIAQLGYAGYFLAAAEIAAEARALDIPLAPRGSAVGSLVVHLLGISTLDPLAHGLVFERFLHAARVAPPDIDLDVCSRRRDTLLERCYARFGRDRVALVGAHHRYGLPGALRAGLGAVGVAASQIERLAEALADDDDAARIFTDERLGRLLPCRRETLEVALELRGAPRLLALHPGGTVIAPVAIDAFVPVERAARGFTVAQYDATAIEATGLTKLDLLGNRLLTQLADTLELVGPGATARRALADIAPDDATTLAALDRADTIGCFQVETPALRALLKQLPIRRLEDCAAALALVRPGAGAGAVKIEYLHRAHARPDCEPRAGTDPIFDELLGDTHGLMLYDEDLLRILRRAAGLSLAEADQLRAALIEAGPREREALELEFKRRAAAHGRADAAGPAWRNAAQFAAYSFCKAHALAYALMAFQAVYLKQHHAVEFGCALLRSYGGAYPMRTVAADLVRHGVTVLGPSVNRSGADTCPEDCASGARAIRIGLEHIKHLTHRSSSAILARRAQSGRFATLEELLGQVPLGRRELAALLRSGACDELAPLSADTYPDAHEAFLRGERPTTASASAGRHRASLLRRLQNELEYLGMHLSAHPMAVLRPDAERESCLTSAEIDEAPDGSRARFAGIVAASRRHTSDTGTGRRTLFLTLEDEHGLVDVVIAPPRYAEFAPGVTAPGPYLVAGIVCRDYGRTTVAVDTLWPFHERARRRTTSRA